ncbi:MAG: TIM barrel protein [Candidatus Sumerlaeia bacterium]|nr:TIM barrel protein [Candidatus Sumerlaeia bacterium]
MPLQDLSPQGTRRNATELLLHMQRFKLDLKFSVGVWYLSPGGGRFHDRYREPLTIPERLEMIAELREDGVTGIEAHYPNEVNEENLHCYQEHEKATGQRLLTVIPNLFYEREFEFGSLSNPDRRIRRMAIDRLVATLRLNRELDTDFAVIWPGIDGYENPFGVNFVAWRDRFADSLTEAMETVPGVRVAIEPKPYEPRGRLFLATISDALIMCARVETRLKAEENLALHRKGQALVCMNPEVGHVLMGYEDLADSFSKILEQGRLAHTHWNSQPLGNYDQDLNVGVVSPEQTEAGLYCLKMHGYTGHFGIDINPERMPALRAIRNSIDAIKAANDRIETLDHEHIMECAAYPEIDRGWIEAHLIRKRSPNPGKLWPLGPPVRGDERRGE